MVQPNDAEVVLHAVLKYDSRTQPESLSITPPGLNDSQRQRMPQCLPQNLPVTDF